ncbi:11047_t:CDS:2 [Funneliformis caledonium]|uniref:11047_t:CDS:1 n=1 Tax=Funneliformis caledonium TaxID=1117310 RepID=A0A9N9BMK6_9GLOM|nr:11047_t:CDS:2 [Funneliformis caledonium]
MSPISYTPVEELKPDQHQVNLKVKVIAQIILGEVDDYSQINILQPNAMVLIHNARVEMYRGFMRIVADQNINAEIKPVKDNWIMINDIEDDDGLDSGHE